MNFWSLIAAAVVILKLCGVVTLGWGLTILITVLLLLGPLIIILVGSLVAIITAGAVVGGATVSQRMFGRTKVKRRYRQ